METAIVPEEVHAVAGQSSLDWIATSHAQKGPMGKCAAGTGIANWMVAVNATPIPQWGIFPHLRAVSAILFTSPRTAPLRVRPLWDCRAADRGFAITVSASVIQTFVELLVRPVDHLAKGVTRHPKGYHSGDPTAIRFAPA
jgi:hypothetical protein